MGRREVHKARTRDALRAAAMRLFTERGFDGVTMDDVASAAGVSRRTAFRYFRSKDDLVMTVPLDWIPLFDDAVAQVAGQPIGLRLRHASRAIATHVEADPEPVRTAVRLASTHPALADRYGAVSQQWINRLVAEIGGDGDVDAESRIRARMLGAAVMGVLDSVLEVWVERGGSMHALIDLGFDLLAPALDDLDGSPTSTQTRPPVDASTSRT